MRSPQNPVNETCSYSSVQSSHDHGTNKTEGLTLVTPKAPTGKRMERNATHGTQNVKHNVLFSITAAISTSKTKTISKDQVNAMAKGSAKQMMA